MAALVGAEFGVRGKALGAHLALEQVLLLVALHVCLEVVHGGKLLAATAHRAAEGPQLVVRLQVPLELVGGSEGPAAAVQRALEGPPALAAAVRQQVHLELVLLGEGERALRLGTAVARGTRARTLGTPAALGRARDLLARWRGRASGRLARLRRRGGQREDAVIEAHQQVLAVNSDGARESRAGPGGGGCAAGARLGVGDWARASAGPHLPPPGVLGRTAARHFQQHHERVATVLGGRGARPRARCRRRGLPAQRPWPAIFGAPQQ